MKYYLFICIFFIGCGGPSSESEPQAIKTPANTPREVPSIKREIGNSPESDIQLLTHNYHNYVFDVFTQSNFTSRNNLITPYGAYVNFAQIYFTAQHETETELKELFYFEQDESVLYPTLNTLDQALFHNNARPFAIKSHLWIEQSYKLAKRFTDNSTQYFGTEVNLVDLIENSPLVGQALNSWATANTSVETLKRDKLDAKYKIILATAIQLNSNWAIPFPIENTFEGLFTRTNMQTVTAEFVATTGSFNYYAEKDESIIELPLENQEYAFYVITTKPESFEDMLGELSLSRINQLISSLTLTDLAVTLPKFEINNHTSLTSNLPLSTDKDNADFSLVNDQQLSDLYLNYDIQSNNISLTDSGLTSSSLTTLGFEKKPEPISNLINSSFTSSSGLSMSFQFLIDKPVIVDINGPFIFFIKHKTTNIILQMGTVVDPSV